MNDTNQHFRTAYVPHNSGHDLTALKDLCDRIVFCSNGYEGEIELPQVILEATKDFDPDKDIIVPVGNVISNVLTGAAIALRTVHIEAGAEKPVPVSQFFMAVYKDKAYSVREVILGKEAANASQD
jgi:hypothetical protein